MNQKSFINHLKSFCGFIVSLTSYGIRLQKINKTLNSLLNQSIKPYKIVLTIYKGDILNITNETKDLLNSSDIFDLIICDIDIAPHKKYFYSMQKYKNYAVITVDDDVEYTNDLCESLYNSYKKHPNDVSARRVHLIKRDKDGNPIPYNKWKNDCRDITGNKDLFATGVGGIIYPPNAFNLSDNNIYDIKRCLYADDIYLKYLENKNNMIVYWVKNDKPHGNPINDDEIKSVALMNKNVLKNRNDEYIKIFKI